MKIVSLTCPKCGANLNIENDRKQCFCQYCGTKILLDDESITYRTVDETRIKEIESEEKQREDFKRSVKYRVIATIVMAIIAFTLIMVGYLVKKVEMLMLIGYFPLVSIPFVWMVGNPYFSKDSTNAKKIEINQESRSPIDGLLFL